MKRMFLVKAVGKVYVRLKHQKFPESSRLVYAQTQQAHTCGLFVCGNENLVVWQ